MSYSLFIHRNAQKKLSTFPNDLYRQVKSVIQSLSENPRPRGCLKLSGRDGWRMRIRQYRIIYEIDDENKTVTILDADHRGKIYK